MECALSNHYHFIGQSSEDSSTLRKFITHLHALSARLLNQRQNIEGRKVWHQFWDSRITFENSYCARLNYVMNNPVKHGLVDRACDYPWCSASWFEQNAPKSRYKTIASFKTDSVNVVDDFELR
jgi:putative transposase